MNSKRVARGPSSKRRTQRRKRVQRSKRRVSNRVRRTKYRRRRQKAGLRRTLRRLRGGGKGKEEYYQALTRLLGDASTDAQENVRRNVEGILKKKEQILKEKEQKITSETLGPFRGYWNKHIKESEPEKYYYEFVYDPKELVDEGLKYEDFLFEYHPLRREIYSDDVNIKHIYSDREDDHTWRESFVNSRYVLDNRITTD